MSAAAVGGTTEFLTSSWANISVSIRRKCERGSKPWRSCRLIPAAPTHTLIADAEPAKRTMKGARMVRKKHFQHGSLFKRGKKNKVWVARFWESVIGEDGEADRVRRSEILGTVAELPTRRDAELVLTNRLRQINSANYHPRSCCFLQEFVEEWKPQVLPTLKYATQK